MGFEQAIDRMETEPSKRLLASQCKNYLKTVKACQTLAEKQIVQMPWDELQPLLPGDRARSGGPAHKHPV